MMTIRFSPVLLLGFSFLALGLGIEKVHAADLKFKVQLIWGTNSDKPKDPTLEDLSSQDKQKTSSNDEKSKEPANKPANPKPDNKVKDAPLKEVDLALAEKLRKIFKWKHYYEVFKKEPVNVANLAAQKLRLSKKCEIEMKNLGNSMLEVKLWGEGKLVKTVKQPVRSGECLVLAGDDKNDTAWFVVLTPF